MRRALIDWKDVAKMSIVADVVHTLASIANTFLLTSLSSLYILMLFYIAYFLVFVSIEHHTVAKNDKRELCVTLFIAV